MKIRDMKITRFAAMLLAALPLLMSSCSEDKVADYRERDYGYVQFKLYKAASYGNQSRALVSELPYLSDACKIKVYMQYGNMSINQSLVLNYADKESAEWGLRSDKLQLLEGHYVINSFELYDALDELLYSSQPAPGMSEFDIVVGGLAIHDLTVEVTPRGNVQFTFDKDMSDFTDRPDTRAYTFDEAKYADVTVLDIDRNRTTTFENLALKFSIEFDGSGTGFQTSVLRCDTLVSLRAGRYGIRSCTLKNNRRVILETINNINASFTVEDNVTTNSEVPVPLHESDEYIRDYYALYEIWHALDGEHWYYAGENYFPGANWDFNKDPDLWGAQFGVVLHTNGRVQSLDLTNFGIRGELPDAIGQLTALESLYLGSHNDSNLLEFNPDDPQYAGMNKVQRALAAGRAKHPLTQLSEPVARALKEHEISIPEIALYDKYSESEIIDRHTGDQLLVNRYDNNHGQLSNGLTGISEQIGNLKNLSTLFIANSPIKTLPESLAELESCTDLEVYNCPEMTEFPMSVAKMPALQLLNIGNNKQWTAEVILEGLKALARNEEGNETIQILYADHNNLEYVPEEMRLMKRLMLLDLSSNNISKVEPFGRDIMLVQLYLDNNRITELTRAEDGFFCDYADMETFSVTHNLLTKVPDIFSATARVTMSSVDFSYNLIDGVENGESYRGINVNTLSLSSNKFKTFPGELFKPGSQIGALNLANCGMEEFPKGCFSHENAYALSSLDLTYNKLRDLPEDVDARALPYLYGIDVSYNRFDAFPYEPLYCPYLTVYGIRGQRDAEGERCLREWPSSLFTHKGLRGFYIGSNDIRTVNETISTLIYYLDISDNPNITFDASDICYAYSVGAYILFYDKTQNILNCDIMLQ